MGLLSPALTVVVQKSLPVAPDGQRDDRARNSSRAGRRGAERQRIRVSRDRRPGFRVGLLTTMPSAPEHSRAFCPCLLHTLREAHQVDVK